MKKPGSFLWIYGMPIVLAALGCIGLAAALFADGPWDWVSWASLGAMTAVPLWYACRKGRADPGRATGRNRQGQRNRQP